MPEAVRIRSLHIHPVKSCAGVALDEALIVETGFELDRTWMVVDAAGEFVTQRELPRMALIVPTVKQREVILRAPGMLALHLPVDAAEAPLRVRVWDDAVPAWDMGAVAAQWFSDFLQLPGLRLARFDPEHRRIASPRWTGGIEARVAFNDGYPLLVVSHAALDELNARLAAQGHAAVDMRRFRPNVVIDGVPAHEEDFIDTLSFGEVELKLVKPCARCSIPDVAPDSGEQGRGVMDALSAYRGDARVEGAITFGMNAIVLRGEGHMLRVGQRGACSMNFS